MCLTFDMNFTMISAFPLTKYSNDLARHLDLIVGHSYHPALSYLQKLVHNVFMNISILSVCTQLWKKNILRAVPVRQIGLSHTMERGCSIIATEICEMHIA